MVEKNYEMRTEKDVLSFSTCFFKPEKESVLHKGVYTKEFSSMLFASAASIVAYFILRFISEELFYLHYLIVILIFIASFFGAAQLVFKEKNLEVVFDKINNTVKLTRSGVLKSRSEKIPLDTIESIDIGSKKFTPENIDGIQFVERISLQHGSAMPGLGEEEEFVTLSLKLTDGSERIIFAGKVKDEPEVPLKEIKKFLGK
jgi:hypothetical protein